MLHFSQYFFRGISEGALAPSAPSCVRLCRRTMCGQLFIDFMHPGLQSSCLLARQVRPLFVSGMSLAMSCTRASCQSMKRAPSVASVFKRSRAPCGRTRMNATRGVQKVPRLTQLTTRYAHHILSLFNIRHLQLKCASSSISPKL